MKKQLRTVLFVAGASLIVFTGCKKTDSPVAPANPANSGYNAEVANSSALKLNQPIPVTITATYTGGKFPTFTGTFLVTDGLIPTGTTTMFVQPLGQQVFHCIITLFTQNGSITIREECQFATTPASGVWQIADGTGDYINLRGNGKVMMPPGQEVLEGSISWIR
jgi:hypothetical protein